ncbi:hypothetical protein, partial [Burkholderia thailandensis]|uniref:hypothetical protein n=1 Tax=Burkholderia thailandensis TaxID=57975 RepID=UPI00217F16EC
PATDCQQSFSAVKKVGAIGIDADRVCIDAADAGRQHLIRAAEAVPGMPRFDTDGCAHLTSADLLWSVLRALLFSSYKMGNVREAFVAGFVARIGYDAAGLIERLPRRLPRGESTLIRLDFYQHMIIFEADGATLYVNDAPGFDAPDIPALQGLFEAPPRCLPLTSDAEDVRWSITKGHFLDASWAALE